ncbi:MAG: FIG007959: peptidase, M16 family, partial [uncultured Solirubrobacteraceae bacterium]
ACRAIRDARGLDRNGLGQRDTGRGRAVAPRRAHALPGQRPLRLAGDRPDLRRDGRRAERGHRQGEHVGLRAGHRRAPAARVRRRRGHGLASALRRGRPRQRARNRPRGDRDVRGRAARPRLRRARRGGIRRASAGPRHHRSRRRHQHDDGGGACALPRRALRARRHRHRGGGIARARRRRRPRAGDRGSPAPRAAPDGGRTGAAAAAPALPTQGHRAVPPDDRCARARARRRAALRAARAGQHPRRDVVVAPVSGGSRAPRAGLQRLFVSGAVRRDRADRCLPRHAARQRRSRAEGRRRRARAPARGRRERRGARSLQGERQGAHPAVARVHGVAHEPPWPGGAQRPAAALDRRGRRAHRVGLAGGGQRPPARAAGARQAQRGGDRRRRGDLPRGDRAPRTGARRGSGRVV